MRKSPRRFLKLIRGTNTVKLLKQVASLKVLIANSVSRVFFFFRFSKTGYVNMIVQFICINLAKIFIFFAHSAMNVTNHINFF